jgi:hypothetical protein
MFVISKKKYGKETHSQALGLKNLWKTYKLAYGFASLLLPPQVL